MRGIGIRELKTHASEIIQNVRERHARYIITYRGQPIGLLTPIESIPQTDLATAPASGEAVMAELAQLGSEISRAWTASQASTELLADMRR